LANIGDDLRRGRPAASQKPSCSGTPTDDCKERAARVDGVVTEAANMARQAMISIYIYILIDCQGEQQLNICLHMLVSILYHNVNQEQRL